MKNIFLLFATSFILSVHAVQGPCSEAVFASKELRASTIQDCVERMEPYLSPYFKTIGLAHAVKNGNLKNVQEWIKQGAHPDRPKNIGIFAMAAASRNIEIVEELLKAGARFNLPCPAEAQEESLTNLRASDIISNNIQMFCMSDTRGSDDQCMQWCDFQDKFYRLLEEEGLIKRR